MSIEVKHLKPGDPEFDAIAKQITPIEKVHAISFRTTYIDADRHASRIFIRRNETVDKI